MSIAQLIVSLVNPRFHNFNRPLVLAVLVGVFTIVVTAGIFAFEAFVSKRCNELWYPTPQTTIEVTNPQFVSGFNGQVRFARSLRFGGTTARFGEDGSYKGECDTQEADDALDCGPGGTFKDNGFSEAGGPDDARMFYRQQISVQTFEDRTDPNKITNVQVTTTKRTEHGVCIQEVSAFIVADVSRARAAGESLQQSGFICVGCAIRR